MNKINENNPLKCEEKGCWHVKAKGFVYCVCCLYGKCAIIEIDRRFPVITT